MPHDYSNVFDLKSDAPIDVKHFETRAVCLCREGY